ncbi:MAG: DNA alkylation repair protein [Pseudomonadota bacterium]
MTGASAILPRLQAAEDPERAAKMVRYHKTDRPVLGLGNPVINAAVSDWREERPVEAWIAEAEALWASGIFEARIAAGKLLIKARYSSHEAAVWNTIAGWAPDFDGWAIADAVADAGGRRVMADLARLDALEIWSRSDHLWTRRAAFVFTLGLARLRYPKPPEQAARERVLGWAAEAADAPDWFLQKAVSWWLRTLSDRDPGRVRAFLADHGARMAGFAQRDAARKLPPLA